MFFFVFCLFLLLFFANQPTFHSGGWLVRGGSVAMAVDVSEGWQETQDMSHVKCDT